MLEIERPELIEVVKPQRIDGLRRRLLMILLNNRNWLSPTSLRRIIAEGYRNGAIDKNYKFNRICIELRELEADGLISKKKASHSHGQASLYIINAYGIEQLGKSLKKE